MLTPVDEIKSKLDIVDIVQEYFPLKQAGVNLKACCPFHDEKTPSFVVSREKQFFHCFGCSEGGDMFTFIQKMENIEFPEALKILANKAGVKLQYQDPKVTNLKTRLLSMQEVAAEYFSAQLWNSEAGKQALKYLKEKRRLSDEIIKDWDIGYALDAWDALGKYLKTKGFSEQEIAQGGLVVPKDRGGYYDRFRDRIMFPIEDHHGNTVGFTGRAMKSEESAKYVNSPQTLVYNKSEVIFGLSKAKQVIKDSEGVILVEGQMDVIASHGAGIKNVVAVSGTALTHEQINILKRFTNNIIFSFDADTAGVGAAKRGIEMAWTAEVNVKVVAIASEMAKDPDDLIQKDPELWKKLIKEAVSAMDYFFNLEFKEYNPSDINKKKEVAKNLLNLILKLSSPIERDFYLKKLADRLGVEESILRETLVVAKSRIKTRLSEKEETETDNKEEKRVDSRRVILERLLGFMLLHGDYADYISQNLTVEYLVNGYRDVYKTIIVYYTKFRRNDWNMEGLIEFVKANRVDLLDLFNPLLLLVESELGSMDHKSVISEMKKIVYFFKKEGIKARLASIGQKLKQAEKKLTAGNFASAEEEQQVRAQVNQSMIDFQELTRELREVENL